MTFITDLHAHHFAVDDGRRGVRAVHLDGAPAGPVVNTGLCWARGESSPLSGRLLVSSFERGAIECFDWRMEQAPISFSTSCA